MKTAKAIELAGGRKELAKLLGGEDTPITQSAITQWGDELPDGRVWQLRVLRPEWFIAPAMAPAAQPEQKAA